MSESTLRRAWQIGRTSLYHYEEFNARYLSTTLRDQKIHCADPANLNDPWDCKPWFNSQSLQDPEVFQKAMSWYHRPADQAKATLRPDLKQQWEASLRSDPKKLVKFIDGQSRSIQGMVSERRLYCLTPDPRSTLMW